MTDRRAAPFATFLFALSVALAVLGTWLAVQVAGTTLPPGTESDVRSALFLWLLLGFTSVGALVGTRRPSNAIGWLLLIQGLVWQLNQVAGDLRIYATFTRPGFPGAVAATWAHEVLWVLPAGALPLTFLVFPSGRLPSPRWRVPLAAVVVGTALLGIALGLGPGPLANNTDVDNPLGVEALGPAVDPLLTVGNPLVAMGFVAGLASLVVRYRRSDAVTRQQLKWVALAVGVIVVAWGAANVVEATCTVGDAGNIRTLPLVLVPAACGIAVLKYRLYDIDLVVNKILVYGGLTAFIVALYVAVVVGLGSVVGSAGDANLALSVAATAAAALVFDPARRVLQRLASRAVYGRRATPYEALASMTRRVSAGYAPDDVIERMARSIAEATGGQGEVWIARGGVLSRSSCWPVSDGESGPLVPLAHPIAVPGRDATFPVRHGDEVLGALTVARPRGDPIRGAEQRLLADLADSAAFVLENARLVDELRSSRQRLVAAQDVERRRVERDLHDGAQQRLLELSLTLRRAERQLASAASGEAATTLADADEQLRQALSELRDLARGIHPAILTEQGVEAAVESLAARLAIPVELDVRVDHRLDPTLESTTYFVTSEALANIVKHAGDARARIAINLDADVLEVEIADDGAGGADPRGSGLQGLADRVAALNGRFKVVSEPGKGTRVRAVLPCE